MKSIYTTSAFLLLAALVVAGGSYIVYVQQPAEIEAIEEQRELARMQQAEVQDLLVQHASTEEAADQAVRKWNARYKHIPSEMNTSDIVQYLEGLTSRGFEVFNIRLSQRNNGGEISHYTFEVDGTAWYSNFYDFVWHIENNRDLYRIRNLDVAHREVFDENPETGEQRRKDMVRFTLSLDAYFGGSESLSTDHEDLIPISHDLLPSHTPPHNSFYPHVRAALPPNDQNLLDPRVATLSSISGERAVLQDDNGRHSLAQGDEVYLGEVIQIDSYNGEVTFQINKGGVIENITVSVEREEDSFRGQDQVVPIFN